MRNGKLASNTKLAGNSIKSIGAGIGLIGCLLVVLLAGFVNIAGQTNNGSNTRQTSDTSNRADQSLKSVARINPSTLAMEFSLPLMTYPGRNGNSMPIGFNYSSKVWRMKTGLSWWKMVNTQPKYYTDIHPKFAERSFAGWTGNLLPPRINEDPVYQRYTEDGKPWDNNILSPTQLNTYWQNILSGFSENLQEAPCGMSCNEWRYDCPFGGLGSYCPIYLARIVCSSYSVNWCEWQGGGGSDLPETPPTVNVYYVKRLEVSMPDGSTQEFRQSDTPVLCGTTQSPCSPSQQDLDGTYLAVDGSGMKLVRDHTNGHTLYMPNGSRYFFPISSAGGLIAEQYIDNDGNKHTFNRADPNVSNSVNTWTDTMGRKIADPMLYFWDVPSPANQSRDVNLPGLDGDNQLYKLKWESLKPVGCETDTTLNCEGTNGTTGGALEHQNEVLYYDGKYNCAGLYTTLQPASEVLFPSEEDGILSCGGFNILRNAEGEPVLDEDGNAIPIIPRFNPVVLTEITLPNEKTYKFKYNRYGEITKITYPTGSFETFEYGYVLPMNGSDHPAYDQTNRGVKTRRIYNAAGTLQQTWKYSDEINYTAGAYKITTKSSTGDNPTAEITRNVRLINPSNVDNPLFGFNAPSAGFPKEELSYDELGQLRSRTLTEYTVKTNQITTPQAMGVDRDVRVKRSISVAIENGLALASLSETEYDETGNTDPEHFAHLNVKRTKGYHYAAIPLSLAQTGTIAQIAPYFNNNLLAGVSETDYVYDADYKARGIPSLATETRVLNPQNNEVLAKTQTVYDNQVPASNSNYPYSVETYGISGTFECPSGSTSVTCWQVPGSTHLGRPTTVRLWDDDNNIWHESHTRYDIFGNAIKVKDAAGNEAETIFENSFLYAYPTKIITPAPDPTNTTGTNQTSTAESIYDFTTGLTLEVKNDFGQITKTEYNDSLLRPTRVYADNFTAPETQTIYDDTALTVKVRKQIDATNWDEATTFLDSLGRTVKTQSKDSQGDVFTETEYDFLGRVKRSSNPYRDGDTKYWNRAHFDEMGRAIETCAPMTLTEINASPSGPCPTGKSLGVTEFDFSTQTGFVGTVVTSTDASGRKGRSITNALGQLIRVDEPSSSNTLEPLPQSTPAPNPSPSPTPTGGGGPTGCIANSQNCLNAGDYPMNSTHYIYNAQGKMVRVIQGDQNRYFKYDSLGRLIRVRQPEQEANDNLDLADFYNTSGKWSAAFNYDALGNLRRATDANGVNIINEYDKAKRPIKRCYTKPNISTTAISCASLSSTQLSENTPTVTNLYDGFMEVSQPPTASPNYAKGKLTRVSSSVSETRYTQYNNLGQLIEMQQITDGQTFTSSYQYNLSGALVQETYPSGRVVKNEFESDGDLSRIWGKANSNASERTYANSFSYTADGKIEKIKLGNNRWEWAKFNERLQVTELNLGIGVTDASLWKLTYEYGELQSNGTVDTNKNTGNIARQTISFNGLPQPFVQTYKYDSLYRLTEAKEVNGNGTTPTQNWKQQFSYDRYGNRLTHDKYSGTTLITPDNKTHPTIDPNTNRFNSNQGYSYDKNGNLIGDAEGRSFVFNGENKQSQIIKNGNLIGEYFYDGEGKRIKKFVFDSNGALQETTVFVYSSGKLVAEYSTAAPPPNPTTKWTATDQLGSPRAITDSNGQVISRRDFLPFGEEITDNTGERQAPDLKYNTPDGIRQKFTGYQKDEETNLDFAEARMYENRHGRFTAVDPLLASGKSANPQTFNRYTYVMNNPLVFTDPTGLQVGQDNEPCKPNEPCDSIGTFKTNRQGKPTSVSFHAPVAVVDIDGQSLESLEPGDFIRIRPREPTYMQRFLNGFPESPFSEAGEGFVTGVKNIPIVFSNTVTTVGTIGDSIMSGNATVDFDSLSINFGTNPFYIKPYGCNSQIACNFSTGTTTAGLSAPGIIGGVFRGGATSLSEIAIQNSSPNYVYRGVTDSQMKSIATGNGISAKNPAGSWSLEEHLVRGSSKAANLKDPWISTTPDLAIAKAFSKNVIRIDTNKIPFTTPMFRGAEIFPRSSRAFQYSFWQNETSIFQRVPQRAISFPK